MPITYHVAQDGLRIETFPKGVLDIKETISYFEKLKNDGRIKQDAVEIVFFEQVTDFKISYLEGERITKRYQEPKSLQKIQATIFVGETELAFGIGRMLQAFHEITNPKHRVLVVRSRTQLEDIISEL